MCLHPYMQKLISNLLQFLTLSHLQKKLTVFTGGHELSSPSTANSVTQIGR